MKKILILFFAFIAFFFGLLFYKSFSWKWQMGKSKSFHSGSVHYHKSNVTDISWMKVVFYPVVISGALFSLYSIYGIIKEEEEE